MYTFITLKYGYPIKNESFKNVIDISFIFFRKIIKYFIILHYYYHHYLLYYFIQISIHIFSYNILNIVALSIFYDLMIKNNKLQSPPAFSLQIFILPTNVDTVLNIDDILFKPTWTINSYIIKKNNVQI